MKTFAIVRDGVVVNRVQWDGKTKYEPDGQLVEIPQGADVQIGDICSGMQFTPNPQRLVAKVVSPELGLIRLRAAALRAIEDKRLKESMTDPNAPQAVKDYAAALPAFSEPPAVPE